MNESSLFPDEPILTPEEQVRENERLNSIEDSQIKKAHTAIHTQKNEAELTAETVTQAYGLELFAKESATELIDELDPRFEEAENISISRVTMHPSRFLFLKRMVPVIEKEDLAAWSFIAGLDADIYVPWLGRDGALYGWHVKNPQTQSFILKPIDIHSLSLEDIASLRSGLDTLMMHHRILRGEEDVSP